MSAEIEMERLFEVAGGMAKRHEVKGPFTALTTVK